MVHDPNLLHIFLKISGSWSGRPKAASLKLARMTSHLLVVRSLNQTRRLHGKDLDTDYAQSTDS
jgi:hypothetical protein